MLRAGAQLPEADVLLTSSYAFAHAFRTRNEAPHLCYCYSPLRFAWSMTDEYADELWMAYVAAAGFPAARRALGRRTAARPAG